MKMTIPPSEVGRFTTHHRAKAYLKAQRIKKEVETAAASVMKRDNHPEDANSDRGYVVLPDVDDKLGRRTDGYLKFDPDSSQILDLELTKTQDFAGHYASGRRELQWLPGDTSHEEFWVKKSANEAEDAMWFVYSGPSGSMEINRLTGDVRI